jgi:hypothetical protein
LLGVVIVFIKTYITVGYVLTVRNSGYSVRITFLDAYVIQLFIYC